MVDSALHSLALLKVYYDMEHDYFSMFLPMVAECLKLCPDTIITAQMIEELMISEFQLKIPRSAIDLLLKKAAQNGYLKIQNKAYLKDNLEISTVSFNKQREMVADKIRNISIKIKDYAITNLFLPG